MNQNDNFPMICKTCSFAWDSDGGGCYDCRKYAPRPIVVAVPCDNNTMMDDVRYSVPVVLWPSVNDDDWCAEWEKASSEQLLQRNAIDVEEPKNTRYDPSKIDALVETIRKS